MDWQEAVRDAGEGVHLLVYVRPGAKGEAFPDGFEPYREGRLGVKVRAQAQEGAANDAVCALVAAFFGADVAVVAGAIDRRKTLHVSQPKADVLAALGKVLS